MTKHPAMFDEPLCRQTGPELFFPRRSMGSVDVLSAKKICSLCKHIVECREYALQYKLDGVWGGTSVNDRAAIQRQRKIVPEALILER